jgi:hypothetical protein
MLVRNFVIVIIATRVSSRGMRAFATSRKVAGSSPDEVILILAIYLMLLAALTLGVY